MPNFLGGKVGLSSRDRAMRPRKALDTRHITHIGAIGAILRVVATIFPFPVGLARPRWLRHGEANDGVPSLQFAGSRILDRATATLLDQTAIRDGPKSPHLQQTLAQKP